MQLPQASMGAVFTKPEDFHPVLEAAGCYCVYQDKFLILKRAPHKAYGNTWGVPGGKLEKGETHRDAVIREVFEEVGIAIGGDDLTHFAMLYNKEPVHYIFHLYRKNFSALPQLALNLNEHVEAQWVTIEEASRLPLIIGGREALQCFTDYIAKNPHLL